MNEEKYNLSAKIVTEGLYEALRTTEGAEDLFDSTFNKMSYILESHQGNGGFLSGLFPEYETDEEAEDEELDLGLKHL